MDKFVMHESAFEQALEYARKKHPFNVERDLTESLIRKMWDKKRRIKFREAIRFSLNELHIDSKNDNKKREAYRSAATKYFSINGAIAKKARAARKTQLTRKVEPVSVEGSVIMDKNGQYSLLF